MGGTHINIPNREVRFKPAVKCRFFLHTCAPNLEFLSNWLDCFFQRKLRFHWIWWQKFLPATLQNLLPKKVSNPEIWPTIGPKPRFFTLKFVAGSKISYFGKYGFSASFCTSNQVQSPKTRKSRSHQSFLILTKMRYRFFLQFWDFSDGVIFVKNRKL